MKETNNTLNIFKGIACLGIVIMHCSFPDPVRVGARAIGCFGVPLFFCISGYYFFYSGDIYTKIDVNNTVRKLEHSIKLVVCSELFYIVFSIFYYQLFIRNEWNQFQEEQFKPGWIEKFFVQNQPPLYSHLWFLYALATLYFCMLFIKSRKQLLVLSYLASFIGIIFIVFLQEFNFLKIVPNGFFLPGSETMFYKSSIFIFRALPFFCLGILFRNYSHVIQKQVKNVNFIRIGFGLFIFFLFMSVIEAYLFPIAQFYVGSVLAMATAMIISVNSPNYRSPMDRIGGNLSLWIYIIHISLMRIYDKLCSKLLIKEIWLVKWTRPIVVICLSIIVADVIEKVRKHFFTKATI